MLKMTYLLPTGVLAALLLVATGLTWGAEAVALRAALESISSAEMRQHIDTLANDTFEGREAGTRGGHAAANYLVPYLQQAGLKPAGENGSYMQAFGANFRNILGVLEGSDPTRRHEVILIGAHYDHVGYGNSSNSYGPYGHIHNGADDNASGTAALLELIGAFSRLEQAPKRTVLFALWDGEEKGLLGSKHWIEHLRGGQPRPLLAFNIDMIGRLRDNTLTVLGARTSPGLRRLIAEANDVQPLALQYSWKLERDSDHWSFLTNQTSVLMFHTGLHNDYHRPSDDAEKVDAAGIERVTRLAFRVLHTLAESEQPIPFRAVALQETVALQKQREQPLAPLPGRLGIQWSPQNDNGAIIVTGVRADSAAARGGVRRGDRIVAVQDEAITADDFAARVLAASKQISLSVLREGEPAPQTLSIDLDGSPVRWGLTWQADEAEPRVATVMRVVSGSVAERAGVQFLDRIMRVNAQELVSTDELSAILAQATGEVTLLIERSGQLKTLVMKPIGENRAAGAPKP